MAGPLRDPGPRTRDRLRSMAAAADSGGGSPGTSSGGAAQDLTDARPAVADPAADDGPAPAEVEPLPDAPLGAIDEWSLDQLHRRASEVDLEGRWEMTREELVEALRGTP